ncbi:MAG: hypothetical protein CSB44_04035 [Gammaproteobacteria bacterium]|nr:MAG: hypothetical protein CSB44_04035 [Gammaproteobacteria bacterium]
MAALQILRHVRNYATAGVVSGIVGLLAFPLMTRNLPVDDYGILGLVTASATLAVAFGKLGIQHAIVRFYAGARHSDDAAKSLLAFHSTVFVLLGCLSLLTAIVWIISGTFIVPRFIENPNLPGSFAILSLMIILRMIGSANWNLLRARQESHAVGMGTILARCSYIVMLLILLVSDNYVLHAVLAVMVVAELVGALWAVNAYRPWFSFSLASFSTGTAGQLLRFGMPLMVLEALSVVLRLVDRYMIGSTLGAGPLGLYAASYNLCGYIELVITASLAAAVRPMLSDIWAREGSVATRPFLEQGLHFYLIIGIPFLAIFNLVAPELLQFLAGSRYEAGASIIPWISTTVFLDGSLIFLSAGMYLLGSTNTLVKWGLISGAVNLVGNYLVIPLYGIVGAACITLLAYSVFAAGIAGNAMRLLHFGVSWRRPLIMLLLSLAITLPLVGLDTGEPLYNLLLRGAIATLLLFFAVCAVDQQVRIWLHGHLSRITARFRQR